MQKRAEAFRSIGEVAQLIGVATHVLRYWETQFPQLKPMKRADGRRYYRPDDVRLAAGLYDVLRDEGLTIRGAKKLISRDRGETVRQRGAALLATLQDQTAEPEALGAEERTPTSSAAQNPKPQAQASTPIPVATAPQTRALPPAVHLCADWLTQLARLAESLRQTKKLTGPARKQAILLQQTIQNLG